MLHHVVRAPWLSSPSPCEMRMQMRRVLYSVQCNNAQTSTSQYSCIRSGSQYHPCSMRERVQTRGVSHSKVRSASRSNRSSSYAQPTPAHGVLPTPHDSLVGVARVTAATSPASQLRLGLARMLLCGLYPIAGGPQPSGCNRSGRRRVRQR